MLTISWPFHVIMKSRRFYLLFRQLNNVSGILDFRILKEVLNLLFVSLGFAHMTSQDAS